MVFAKIPPGLERHVCQGPSNNNSLNMLIKKSVQTNIENILQPSCAEIYCDCKLGHGGNIKKCSDTCHKTFNIADDESCGDIKGYNVKFEFVQTAKDTCKNQQYNIIKEQQAICAFLQNFKYNYVQSPDSSISNK